MLVLSVQKGKIAIKAIERDMHLGGQDFDNKLLNECIKKFNTKYKVDMSKSRKALRRLHSECERAKKSLSSWEETVINIDYLYKGHDFSIKVTRTMFEKLNANLFEKCMEIMRRCLSDAHLKHDQIDDIVLVGGFIACKKVARFAETRFWIGKAMQHSRP